MRSVADMLAGIDPPLAPGCNSLGRLLADLDSHQCRFPLRGEAALTRFCAVEVSAADWLPGFSGGSYCTFHRRISEGRGTDAERAASRVLERLG
ncbi:hypothetical protein [Mesorhizobium sp.]|uniref:hypothetical protein n=1 Tax=Mesorhizobium sp. TaxID=1871066 RepID=UPI000FE9C205|nr:hypothetical protein [Mesorhizobium sp.]RWF66870.1 MAG: hypothetical protein EOS47_04605 [Mesorhizobium sp.]